MDRVTPADSVVVVIDAQDRLVPALAEVDRDPCVRRIGVLLDVARELGVPVLATEQYPKGLGPTVPSVKGKLDALGVVPVAKTTFDATGEPAFVRALAAVPARRVILVGFEAHVCVFQTARELARRGLHPIVIADATASRRVEDKILGHALADRAGALVMPLETVVFDWLERAGTPTFKAVSAFLK
ncbi:MAG: isochorismatase family protein [Polyangiaceae bacterium]